MPIRSSPTPLVATLLLVLAAPAQAEPAKPLSKPEEKAKFHAPARGMAPDERLSGFEKRLQMEDASLLGGLSFRSVGPEVQGGRVVDIEGVPAREDSLLVAFASGGLWRTDNRGGSWTPLFDRESAMTIGDIAVADPEARVLYVGSGEANSSRTSYAGTGVFKTEDGGRTWKNLGLTDTHHIGRVIVDRRDPKTVFVAAMGHLYTENEQRGVFRSKDGGASWERVLFVDEWTGAIDVLQDPVEPNTLYAATWERSRRAWNFLESGPGSGIWKSIDGGTTWTRLSGGLPTGATVGRIGLAATAAKAGRLYAVLDNQALRPDSEPADEEAAPGELTPRRLKALSADQFQRVDDASLTRFLKQNGFPKSVKPKQLKADVKAGKTSLADVLAFIADANSDLFRNPIVQAEVWRSDDGGATWSLAHSERIEKVFYSYGYYFARVIADPRDADRIYVLGMPAIGSTDGGRTFTGVDRRGVHVDHHALWIDPAAPNRVALGNDGGLNLSFDHGQTWTTVNNLPVGQFTTLAVDDATPYNIVGGLQDNGVMRGPSTHRPGISDPSQWKSILGGDGSAVAIDPKDANQIYTAFQFGHAYRLNLKTAERAPIRPRPELSAEKKEKPLRYNWVTPFIVSPHSNNILYFGTQKLYRSFDRGESWTAISNDLTSDREQGDVPYGTITQIAESPKSFGVLFVGTDEGRVWGTRDGGVTWRDLSNGLAPGRWVTRVIASVHDEGTVYVTQNGYRNDELSAHVWRSTDFGQTWTSLASTLPAEPVNVIREDPKAKHLLYLGTDTGAFVSLDRGDSWTPLTGGLPRVAIHDLQVQPREGDLVLGTHGRSVLLAEAAPLRELTSEVRAKALHAFKVKTVTSGDRRGYGDHPYLTWFRNDPRVRLAWWQKDAGAAVSLTLEDSNGSSWAVLKATSRAGLNELDYDLAADPKLADAAEAVARKKALEKAKADAADKAKAAGSAAKKGAKSDAKGVPEAKDAAPADEDESAEKAEKAAPKPLDDDLMAALADPLRAKRRRFLPPGRYTVDIQAGALKETTSLVVKAPKGGDDEEDDEPEG